MRNASPALEADTLYEDDRIADTPAVPAGGRDVRAELLEVAGTGTKGAHVTVGIHDVIVSFDQVAQDRDGTGWSSTCGCSWSSYMTTWAGCGGKYATAAGAATAAAAHVAEAVRVEDLEERVAALETWVALVSGAADPIANGRQDRRLATVELKTA